MLAIRATRKGRSKFFNQAEVVADGGEDDPFPAGAARA
jgi:hypothetical protein